VVPESLAPVSYGFRRLPAPMRNQSRRQSRMGWGDKAGPVAARDWPLASRGNRAAPDTLHNAMHHAMHGAMLGAWRNW
jgi:hypothetical protein